MARTGSILVVDPENTIADFLVELLTDEGYAVLSASDGPSALGLSISQAPALLLMEYWLPGMTASDLITQLREAGVTSLPIVVMTTDSPRAAPLRLSSVSDYLRKPFDLDELLARVARYVQPARAAETALLSTFAGAIN
jgi:DNA-binding response OmpR family regulator